MYVVWLAAVLKAIAHKPYECLAGQRWTTTPPNSYHLATATYPKTGTKSQLQLGQLTHLNKSKLTDKRTTLAKSKSELEDLLAIHISVRSLMIKEFRELKDRFTISKGCISSLTRKNSPTST